MIVVIVFLKSGMGAAAVTNLGAGDEGGDDAGTNDKG